MNVYNTLLLVLFIVICCPSCNETQKQINETTIPQQNNSSETIDLEGSTFLNQKLKQGERIVTIKWAMEKQVRLPIDNDEGRFASENNTVPNGKKWIMIYANEDYVFEDLVVSMVPMLSLDNKVKMVYGMQNTEKTTINLSKAKDENTKYYSGTNIKGVSSREKGKGQGEDFRNYKGELWFIEVNE